jgi:hypothetical protein
MRRERIYMAARALSALGLVAGGLTIATAAGAQAPEPSQRVWRFAASTGGYAAASALIKSADTNDTRLEAGPALALEGQYLTSPVLAVYGNGFVALPTVRLGSDIQPAVVGPSNQVVLTGLTGGVMLTAADWLGEHLEPTLRLGVGFKWYGFNLTGAANQLRPTADIGLGLRAVGAGPIEGTVEVRYLPSSFDQSKLPTRGIAPQDQRQNDLFFSIGIGIRP